MKNKYGVTIFSGLIFGFFLGVFLIVVQQSSFTGLNLDNINKIKVVLSEDSFISAKGKAIYRGELIEVSGKNLIQCDSSGSVLIIGKEKENQFYWGEVLEFPSLISTLDDSKEFQFIAYTSSGIKRIGWKSILFRIRKAIKERVEKQISFFSDDVSSLFNALFTGNGDYLDKEIKEQFRKSGTSHLLALSGFHVAIIVFLFTFLLKKITGKSVAILLSFPLLLFYLFFSGPSPSLLRAVIMYICGGLFILFHKEISTIQILSVTLFIQLILTPVQGFSLSFQLSYLALTGILIISKPLNFRLRPWIPSFIRIPFAASVGAHIMTSPILIYHFNELYPIGILSSIVLTPLITVFMWLTLFSFLLSFAFMPAILISVINGISGKIMTITIDSAQLFSNAPKIEFSSNRDLLVYLSFMMIIVLSLYIDMWRLHGRRKSTQFKLRFTIRDKSSFGINGFRSEKKMESELSHQ